MYSKFLLLLTTLVLATTLWTSCDDEQTCDCIGDPPRSVASIQIIAALDTLHFIPGDSASLNVPITIIVTDDRGQAYPGIQVEISLLNPNIGELLFVDDELRDTTNAFGHVLTIYHSYGLSDDQVFIASAGGVTVQRALYIRETEAIPSHLSLDITPYLLEADSNEEVQFQVDVWLWDQFGRGIAGRRPMNYFPVGGTEFPPDTDSLGHSSFVWVVFNNFGTFWFKTQIDNLSDSVQVEVRLREPQDQSSLTVTAEPAFLLIDSNETVYSQVTITLLDGFGQGRPNALVNISASGGIIPEIPLTNADGQIQFNWAFHGFGDYYLFAYSEGGLRDSVTVLISLRVHEPPQVNIYTIPANLRVDSNTVGEAFIVVTASDENGILLPNVTPTLTVEVGEFDPPPPTDANGQSQTTWRFFNNFGAFQVTTSIEFNGQTATDSTLINVLYGP